MISSLSSGVTNTTKDVLGISIAIISYEWLVQHIAVYHVQYSWLLYVIAFIALDFSGYWVHRLAHSVNFFWNNHIVHHSSEEFNLACALRQSISVFVRIYTVLLLPAALLGVPSKVIAIVAPLHLFAQFWYHTRHIDRMGLLEYIIVTPSHHRVHHAINPIYLDKNFGQVFIFWDRWFGTYQEELKDTPCVYGITRPVKTWNPIKINFMHMWLLIKDAWRTKDWKAKFTIWFKPLGWRPADVEVAYPVEKIKDVYHFDKYDTEAPKGMQVFLWCQLFSLLLLVSYLFGNVASIGHSNIFIYGAFIFAQVYILTEFMDRNPMAYIFEIIKNAICIGCIIYFRGWFGLEKVWPTSSYILIAYFIICAAVVTTYSIKPTSKRPLSAAHQ
jgi:sterol desaturase/sphingolipid hydroxylase (fatty acid hydroxylase superfamily)